MINQLNNKEPMIIDLPISQLGGIITISVICIILDPD